MNEHPRPVLVAAEVVALCEAISAMDGPAKRVLAERMIDLLVDERPGTARIVASLLMALGDDFGSRLGRSVLASLSGRADLDHLKEQQNVHQILELRSEKRKRRVDVLILAIKEVELIACLRAFGVASGERPATLERGVQCYFCSHEEYDIAIAWAGTDGNVESALKVVSLLGAIRPRLAVLVGMAAGVGEKVSRGDVVVSEEIWAADFEVLTPEGAIPRPKTFGITPGVWTGLTSLSNTDPNWGRRVAKEIRQFNSKEPELCPLPPDMPTDWFPRYKSGVVFAGSRLIEDGSLPDRRDEQNARLLAAEMEGAGFAAACREERGTVDWLVLRGIADEGRTPRPKFWQFSGSYAAAALLRDGLSLGCFSLR